MAKVVVLSAEPVEFKDKESGNQVKMTKLQLLEKIGKDFVVGQYYVTKENPKGFHETMVAPDVFETEFVSHADFEKAVDRKTGEPKLVLASLTTP